MIDLMQNVGEFEGVVIANELAQACTPARMPPMDCSRLCVQRRQSLSYKHAVPRFTPRYEFKALIKNSKIAHSYAFENRRAALCVSAPTKKRPYPLPPPPTYKGGLSEIFPIFPSKVVPLSLSGAFFDSLQFCFPSMLTKIPLAF